MAIQENFTINGDHFKGTSENDTFSAVPVMSGAKLKNTLQTIDTVEGGDGFDMINASLIGGNQVINPVANDVEKLSLHLSEDKNDQEVTLDLSRMPDLEKIFVGNSTGDHIIENTGDVENFVFDGNVGDGELDIDDVTAGTLDFKFTNSGDAVANTLSDGNWEISSDSDATYDVEFENDNATEASVKLTDSNVELEFDGLPLETLALTSEGDSRFELEAGDDLKEIIVKGSGEKLQFDLETRSDVLTKIEFAGADGFTGDVHFTMEGGGTAENTIIRTKQGNDIIDINGKLRDGTQILTRSGDDQVILDKVGDNVLIGIGAVIEGVDSIQTHGDIGNNFQAYMGDSADSFIVGAGMGEDDNGGNNDIGTDAIINTGAGDDVFFAGDIGKNAQITTSSGDDLVEIHYLGEDSHLALGAGNDTAFIESDMEENQTILGRDGDDRITLSGDVGTDTEVTVDGGVGYDTIGLENNVVDDYSDGDRSGPIGIENFEKMEINGGSGTRYLDYDMAKFDDINDVQFNDAIYEGTSSSKQTELKGVTSGVNVTLTEGASTLMTYGLKIDVVDAAQHKDDIVNLNTINEDDANYVVDLVDKIDTVNINADQDNASQEDPDDVQAAGEVTHKIKLRESNDIETINIEGDAHVELVDSLIGTVHHAATLNAQTQTGGVAVNLYREDAQGSLDKTINTGSGDDDITTGAGDDTINTGDASEGETEADRGGDKVDAGDGDNSITTGNGNDRIDAGDGEDTVRSGAGNDRINTGAGDDHIEAGEGDDIIKGKDGKDTILAGEGADKVEGGKGADTIDLGNDDDEDVLEYHSRNDSKGAEHDIVSNFESGEDKIDLTDVTDGDVNYEGEFDLFVDLETAVDNEDDAGLLTTNSILYVETDGHGDLHEDFQIELDGVTELEQSDFVA